MTVKDLIRTLSAMPEDATILVVANNTDHATDVIKKVEVSNLTDWDGKPSKLVVIFTDL